jgi:hypothetical protein
MRPRRAVAVGVTVVSLGGAAFACRQLVGIQDDPPQRLGPTGCGLPFTGDCASCVAAPRAAAT